jgi:hypothetical protein
MTEAEWNSCTDPQSMLRFLLEGGHASDRKLRLFAVACCRKVWHLLATKECRQGVELSERVADEPTYRTELAAILDVVWRNSIDWRGYSAASGSRKGAAWDAAKYTLTSQMWHVKDVAKAASILDPHPSPQVYQAGLLRCVFGSLPFRSLPASLSPAWWDNGNVTRLAQAAYDSRRLPSAELDNNHLAVLADALEDAGADDAELLAHLRSPGPHWRGCFALDAVLGRE